MEEKTILLLRGLPGNGKSSFAEFLKTYTHHTVICCADDFFTDEKGNYNFDATKLYLAHTKCQEKFKDALDSKLTNLIIVANTSTRQKDVNFYRDLAIEKGNRVFVITIENWHNGIDSHNVPKDTIENMKTQLRQSIKL